MTPIALISVSDKNNIIPFAKVLVEKFNYKILSSGGTAKYLSDAKIPVIKVSEYTNSKEILEGRVKTLHPKIHGGILAKRSNKKHNEDLERNNINFIDLVVVNLYPFEKKIAGNCSWEEGIENIDIGGPTMIRSAAKNHKDVAVIVDSNQYDEFINELSKGELSTDYKINLAHKAFEHTANYDAAISNWIFKEKDVKKNIHLEPYPLIQSLRYGENPHQNANWYGSKNFGWHSAKKLHGKELSFNNLLDLESALSTVLEFGYENLENPLFISPAAIILKHNNPCGAALGDSISTAFRKALECDSISAFGGIVALNKKLDVETAKLISNIFIECVVAPSFDEEALSLLKKKKNLRLLELKSENIKLEEQACLKSIMGGILIQDSDTPKNNQTDWEIVTKEHPTEQESKDLYFAWQICKHVKSNAILIAKNNQTLGIGAGQMNRVGAAKIALEAAKDQSSGSVLASDGFFPFADTVEIAADRGIKAIIQPGGSVRDEDSIKMCDSKGISMIFTKRRHFLH